LDWFVGWFGRQATLGSAKISAGVEEKKLTHEIAKHADERRDKADADFRAAHDALKKLRLQAPTELRQGQARIAQEAVLVLGWRLGGERLDRAAFESLLTDLDEATTDEQLDRAAESGTAFLSQIVLDRPKSP
jgi:hypothetical protein